MRFFNFTALGRKKGQKSQYLKISLCFFFILTIFLNFLFTGDSLNYLNDSNAKLNNEKENISEFNQNNPILSTDTSMLQNPFIKNFDLMRQFFDSKYKSSLDPNINTYYRYGDENGTILDDTIYAEDNLLLYKTLLKSEINDIETFDIYLNLKSTPLWYKYNNDNSEYGFVRSVDNSTSQVKDDDRYLYDNLLPIFLLIENIGDQIDDISINNTKPQDSIEEMFILLNSSEYWNDVDKGFYNYNSSDTYYTESNLYSILANLLIHRAYKQYKVVDNKNIKDRTFELANQTMEALLAKMWGDGAFYYYADLGWDNTGPGKQAYHLNVNALGIITLLECWIETGMQNNSNLYNKAITIYNSLEDNLFNDTDPYNLYFNKSSTSDWSSIQKTFDLKANAMMMSACVRLFDLTGNFTFYKRAIEIYNDLELYFFDNLNNAYSFSLMDSGKQLNSNLKLSEAYLRGSEIYSSVVLKSEYNVTREVPNYVFNQDKMNLTSIYLFVRNHQYFNQSDNSYMPFTINYTIINASYNHLIKYPNGTLLDQFEKYITNTSYTFNYTIEETLPIEDGYFIYVWANTSYFGMAENLKRFNVISGVTNKTIEGLDRSIYPGSIINVSLTVNYTRKDNLTLTAYLEGKYLINILPQEINFTSLEEITIYFNITIKLGAIPGSIEIFFKFKKENVLYLSVRKVIEISNSFDYSNLVYESKVVGGDNLYVSLDLINYLQNATQSLNVSFSGISYDIIAPYVKEVNLLENEIKTVNFYLKTIENAKIDSFEIEMNITQNATVYYSEILTIEFIPKFEIISTSFPNAISQGASAYLIILIQYNKEIPENFSLYINNKLVETNIDEFVYGENRLVKKIVPTINPYEFGTKSYNIELKDYSEATIAQFYFEVVLELSTFNFIIFYLLPCIIPIGIILYFVNKEIKHKKLTR
ncbi:MAG: hypothetical protein ACFFHD_01170 [Promethearchaeota archaeon]